MMTKMVSIIMPMFNAALYLEDSLQSIARQTYFNWQLIVIDDGCSDTSIEIFNTFSNEFSSKCLLFKSSKPKSGAGPCRNIGIKNCDGEFVIFFDSDDILEPFCLQQRVNAIQDNDMSIFKQYQWHENNENVKKFFTGTADNRNDAIESFVRMNPPWQTMAPIWRKSALLQLGGFDESLVFMEDPDLHLRALLKKTLKIGFEYNLPADNYYRINNMNADKLLQFYDNSIGSRIIFIRKLLFHSSNTLIIKKEIIREGYFIFIKTFVLARIGYYKKDIVELTNELFTSKVLNNFDRLKLICAFNIFLSNSPIIKLLKLKGLIFKIIK